MYVFLLRSELSGLQTKYVLCVKWLFSGEKADDNEVGCLSVYGLGCFHFGMSDSFECGSHRNFRGLQRVPCEDSRADRPVYLERRVNGASIRRKELKSRRMKSRFTG